MHRDFSLQQVRHILVVLLVVACDEIAASLVRAVGAAAVGIDRARLLSRRPSRLSHNRGAIIYIYMYIYFFFAVRII